MRKSIALLFIIVLISGCAGSFKEKRAVSKPLVTIAMQKIQRDDIQGSLVELRKAVEANPQDPEVYYALTLAYWKAEKYDKALENADYAIDNADNLGLDHPGMKSEAYNLKGTVLVNMGKQEEAIEAFRNAVKDELYATPEYAYYNLASVYLTQKRYPETQQAALQALSANPHYAPAWKILSQAYLAQGQENQAIEALKHAILEFNGFTEAYWDLAQLYIKRGAKQEAIKNLNEVVRLDPNGLLGARAQEQLQNLQ